MVTIVFGLPGSGKSYFAKHLAKDIRGIYLNTDIIREELNKKGEYNPEINKMVYDHLKNKLTTERKSGADIVADGTFQKKKIREDFYKTLKEQKMDVKFIEMVARASTIRQRMEKKNESTAKRITRFILK